MFKQVPLGLYSGAVCSLCRCCVVVFFRFRMVFIQVPCGLCAGAAWSFCGCRVEFVQMPSSSYSGGACIVFIQVPCDLGSGAAW